MIHHIAATTSVEAITKDDACRAFAEQLVTHSKGLGDPGALHLEFTGEGVEYETPEPEPDLTTDHLFGFVAWLTTGVKEIAVGALHDCAPIDEALKMYMAANGLGEVSVGYPETFEMPHPWDGSWDGVDDDADDPTPAPTGNPAPPTETQVSETDASPTDPAED